MSEYTLEPFLKIESAKTAKPKRKRHLYNRRWHVLFTRGRNVCLALEPEIVAKLNLMPGVDRAWAELDGSKVVLIFKRKGGLEC